MGAPTILAHDVKVVDTCIFVNVRDAHSSVVLRSKRIEFTLPCCVSFMLSCEPRPSSVIVTIIDFTEVRLFIQHYATSVCRIDATMFICVY